MLIVVVIKDREKTKELTMLLENICASILLLVSVFACCQGKKVCSL